MCNLKRITSAMIEINFLLRKLYLSLWDKYIKLILLSNERRIWCNIMSKIDVNAENIHDFYLLWLVGKRVNSDPPSRHYRNHSPESRTTPQTRRRILPNSPGSRPKFPEPGRVSEWHAWCSAWHVLHDLSSNHATVLTLLVKTSIVKMKLSLNLGGMVLHSKQSNLAYSYLPPICIQQHVFVLNHLSFFACLFHLLFLSIYISYCCAAAPCHNC